VEIIAYAAKGLVSTLASQAADSPIGVSARYCAFAPETFTACAQRSISLFTNAVD
jgi:hypothetical protein